MATAGIQPEPPLIVIVGPTASGKTGLAISIAREFNGEIISADSRAIYRHLDIGTAKPSIDERQGIPHWGIDLVDPGERFTAADFKQYANDKVREIRGRGKVPILVGGTGLYVDAVIYDYEFLGADYDKVRRAELESLTIGELCDYCFKHNIALPENNKNKRYVVNNILRNGHVLKRRKSPISNCLVVGITTEKQLLRQRIHERAMTMFGAPVCKEATDAAKNFGWDNEAMTGNIYPLIRLLHEGTISRDEAIGRFEILDWRLAKRQLTWLRRNEHIRWFDSAAAYTYIAQRLVAMNES